MLKEGSWWIRSESDPRWNRSGRGQVGMFMVPAEAEAEKASLEARYGPPPEDLEFGYMKD
jgi:hypothetical protein